MGIYHNEKLPKIDDVVAPFKLAIKSLRQKGATPFDPVQADAGCLFALDQDHSELTARNENLRDDRKKLRDENLRLSRQVKQQSDENARLSAQVASRESGGYSRVIDANKKLYEKTVRQETEIKELLERVERNKTLRDRIDVLVSENKKLTAERDALKADKTATAALEIARDVNAEVAKLIHDANNPYGVTCFAEGQKVNVTDLTISTPFFGGKRIFHVTAEQEIEPLVAGVDFGASPVGTHVGESFRTSKAFSRAETPVHGEAFKPCLDERYENLKKARERIKELVNNSDSRRNAPVVVALNSILDFLIAD